MYIGLHVKYPLFSSDFNENWIFLTDFSNNPQIPNSINIRPVGAELFHKEGQTAGQTNMPKLTVAFSSSANTPRNLRSLLALYFPAL
jgi:hypothetical protein